MRYAESLQLLSFVCICQVLGLSNYPFFKKLTFLSVTYYMNELAITMAVIDTISKIIIALGVITITVKIKK